MTLLSIVQSAAVRCGVKKKPTDITSVMSSADEIAQQLAAYAADAAQDCMERADWRDLKMEGQISGDGGTTQWPLPVDFQRMSKSDSCPYGSLFSYTLRDELYGPVSEGWLLSAKVSGAHPANPVWRVIGGAIEVWPALALNDVVVFNYVSKNWCMSADGSRRRPTWEKDDDISLVSEDTVMKGAIWRWKRSKGLDYAEEFRDYETSLSVNAAHDTPSRVVQMSGSRSGAGDTFWPWTIR